MPTTGRRSAWDRSDSPRSSRWPWPLYGARLAPSPTGGSAAWRRPPRRPHCAPRGRNSRHRRCGRTPLAPVAEEAAAAGSPPATTTAAAPSGAAEAGDAAPEEAPAGRPAAPSVAPRGPAVPVRADGTTAPARGTALVSWALRARVRRPGARARAPASGAGGGAAPARARRPSPPAPARGAAPAPRGQGDRRRRRTTYGPARPAHRAWPAWQGHWVRVGVDRRGQGPLRHRHLRGRLGLVDQEHGQGCRHRLLRLQLGERHRHLQVLGAGRGRARHPRQVPRRRGPPPRRGAPTPPPGGPRPAIPSPRTAGREEGRQHRPRGARGGRERPRRARPAPWTLGGRDGPAHGRYGLQRPRRWLGVLRASGRRRPPRPLGQPL